MEHKRKLAQDVEDGETPKKNNLSKNTKNKVK